MDLVEIGPANRTELSACFMLMPQLVGLTPELFTARCHGRLVGAAAILWQSWSDPGGFPIALHVLPSERGRGLGRRLLAHVAETAVGETDGLWSLESLADADPRAHFLRACGFEVAKTQLHFEVEGAPFHAHMMAIVRRLRDRNRIPAAARTTPARSAPLDALAKLMAAEFGRGPVQLRHRLERSAIDSLEFDLDRSVVVMDGSQVAGALLVRWNDGRPTIAAHVVAQPWRKGWANALLLETTTRIGLEGGATRFQFHCDDDLTDTTNLALRGAGRQVAAESNYYYAITAR